ncbi:fimbria/pilus periplasmic chaperone [Sphingobium bisphenolivorans]|uniref:fimbria/pilus periplasmic chaperone n=1 Tax=Sphingobium bisphenolivorans TaxID=1335760 RepID=UPI0006861F88|nr:fimbria/pilus periplasmic chaperone [Sphingobium bisphenolivorans]
MVVDLQTTGRAVVANISVNNSGDKPLTMEVAPQALDPTAAGLDPSKASADDLLVVPPTALIQPGQTQTFRVQWIGDPQPSSSHHYYVGINQLPVKLPEGQSAVQIVYNFNVLVNVGPTNGKAALAIQSAVIGKDKGKPAPSITVANSGTTYGYVSQRSLKLVETDASGKEVFNRTISGNDFQQLVGYGLVATGQTRTMVLPIELPSATGTLTATLLDERAP